MNALQAVIFDLDDTLFPVSSLPPALMRPIIEAARRANVGPDAIAADRLEHAFEQARRLPFPAVVADHALPQVIVRAWDAANRALRAPQILEPYDDVWPVLPRLPQRRFLVTTGYRAFQEGKLAALRIAPLFDQIYIDEVGADLPHQGKPTVFRTLLAEWRLAPSAALVVGDSERGEIAAARALGMPAVQILRPGVEPASTADWQITTLRALPELIARIEAHS